eukprot:6189458-Pleurochrysis_carterae.AAC.1
MISDIIPEWRVTDNKKKKGIIALLTSWTGEMMNSARIQMKTWVTIKNEHKTSVQRRWDNRGKMHKAFQKLRRGVWHAYNAQAERKEDGEGRIERERTYGMKHWGRVRTIPRILREYSYRTPEAFILARGDITIPYLYIFVWIPSHVGIVPNIIADNIAAKEQGEAPEGMITSLISKQIKSRPIIYNRKVQGHMELADNPIYQEVRKRGKKGIRDMHKPPKGGDKCEGE